MSRVIFTERATPDVPAANKIQLYAKTDGKLYYMADDGIEVEVGGGGITLPLGISDGGTGEITAEDALAALGGIPLSTVTALGQLLAGTGAGAVAALPPGTNGQVLAANDTEPAGLEWVDLPAPPTVPTAASTVVAETSFGASSVVGTSTDYARADHTHGTPAVPSHSGLTNLSWTASGHTAPSAAVAGFDAGGAAIAVAPSPGYLVLTSKNGFLSWMPYALGLAFSTLTGPGNPSPAINTPVIISTGTFT